MFCRRACPGTNANTGSDITFGVRDIAVTATVYARQVGPLLQDGSARYKYLGCYYDGAGRQLNQKYVNAANDNGNCQQTCLSAGYKFAGTQYRKVSRIRLLFKLTRCRH